MVVDGKTLKYLPYSGRRYIVGLEGSIFDKEGNELPTKITESGVCVELSWLDGPSDYLVGMLVIVTYHPMYLPEHLWKEIEPLYIDEDPDNNRSENLTYRFKCGLLEYERYIGFYYVPHYTKYAINRDGVMVNADNGRDKAWYQVKPDLIRNSKGGYFCTRVVNVEGVNSLLLRHRALCLTFKEFESADTLNLVVNHKDGIPGNDRLDNLEWVTYSKNNQHAHDMGLTGKRKLQVLVKDLRTGEITIYNGTKAAAKAHGYSNTAPIRYRLRHKQATLFTDYLQFKLDDNTPWPEISLNDIPECCYVGERMAARNVFTGEVIVFNTFDEGSKRTGIDKQTIMIHIRDRQIMPFKGFNFAYYEDAMVWPEHTEWHLKAYRAYPVRTPDPVILTDITTGEERFFESRNELAKFLDISQSYATQITLNGWTYRERYWARYYNLRENVKVPSDWKV